jgi:DnaK suppressor protein
LRKKVTIKRTTKKPAKNTVERKRSSRESEEKRQERLKKLLLGKRGEILAEAKEEIGKFIRGENRQLVETALDDGDWSIVDLVEDVNLKLLSMHKENLNKIDEALRKLLEGTYGICEDCDSEISEQRLNLIPFAICCVECMEMREKLQEIEKEG